MIKFYTDHYFQIGSAHYTGGKPCQDYALSGTSESVACAIVSDGCSSGRHTDIGSRILTLSTMQAIRDHAKASRGALDTAVVSITSRQQQIINSAKPILGLNRDDMLATCAYVYMTQKGGFIHLQGDGVVALKYRDDDIAMYRYEWLGNMPFYPAYNDRGMDDFIVAHGGNLYASRLNCTEVVRDTSGITKECFSKEHTLKEGIDGILLNISEIELKQLEYIAVFSDGVTQVDEVDWRDAVSTFLSFKNTVGDFAKRRMIRGIKDMYKIGRGPIDDIAYAVVRIESDGEEVSKKDG